ncbi:hypothetical protein AAFO92_15980 [Roseovarius sp. CAU 1744]|uniref:hypothetical protein n=1 Tax=Roseovarius sp. CAU 1744 TaxID=3140368 RepID=UPI00325B2CB4
MRDENNQDEPESARAILLNLVKTVPSLKPNKIARSALCYPKLSRPGEEDENLELQDVDFANSFDDTEFELDESLKTGPDAEEGLHFPIPRLLHAVKKASEKPEFGKTRIERWHDTLIFSENRIERNSSEERFEWVSTTTTRYSEGVPINASRDAANHWFRNTLVPGLLDEHTQPHSRAVVGAPGCGKSTLFKYLLSENSRMINKSGIVFSRFEFMKFWRRWCEQRDSIERALEDYMSFIHARDLFLSHFFWLVDGCQFRLRMEFQSKALLETEVDRLEHEVLKHAPMLGVAKESIYKMLVQETFARAHLGNSELIAWLSQRTTKERKLLITALWKENNCLVTIFDGLDSLRTEDAFRESKEWKAVNHIIENRHNLSAPTELLDLGRQVRTNSVLVMRNNTADTIEAGYAGRGQTLGIQKYFHLDNIDGLTSMVSVVTRASSMISDVAVLSEAKRDKFVFDVMRVLQRTFLAIWRGHGPSVSSNLIYEFFDGNLRELFRFVARLVLWTVQEMLARQYLESHEYYNASTPRLVRALASSRGNDFLSRKSYRIVELLLFRKGDWFENQAIYFTTQDPMMQELGVGDRLVGNTRFSGEIDNIFNYTKRDHAPDLDHHCMLEKIRIVQLCSKEPLSYFDLEAALLHEFGYVVSDLRFMIRFLQKTDFLTSRVHRNSSGVEFRYSATARGKLCVNSLISNLSYVEHVFHRTLIPEILVNLVDDIPREENTRQWAAFSARNAFILLAYFKALEANPANDVPAAEKYRLYTKLQTNLHKSLERMTRPGAPPQGALEQSEQIQSDAVWICETAVKEIEAVLQDWRAKGLI